MNLRCFLVAAFLVPALAMSAGCGDDDSGSDGGSDTEQVTAVIEEAYGAFAAGDGATFCANLSSDYLADFEEYYNGSCEDEVAEGSAILTAEERADLESPEIADIEISGDTAQTTTNADDLEVVNENGEWKLDDFDVPGGA